MLKTSVTPNNLSEDSINRRIHEAEQNFLERSPEHEIVKVVDFNKSVCTEFGLTMYMANKRSNDLFERVDVTS